MQNLSNTPEEEKHTVQETKNTASDHAPDVQTRFHNNADVQKLLTSQPIHILHKAIWTGFILSAWVSGLCAWGLIAWTTPLPVTLAGYSNALLVLVPMLGGLLQAFCWRRFEVSLGKIAGYSAINALLSCIGAAIFLHEGAICLLMAFPLLWLSNFVGALIGNAIFRQRSRPLKVSIVPVVLAAMVWDVIHPAAFNSSTTTRIVVNAPAETVGKYIVAFPKIETPPTFWLCQFGLPYPMQTTAESASIGAKRNCLLSGNLIVREEITAYEPGKSVTFAITEQPRHPEIAGHFDLLKGQISAQDNGNGTSTLTGTSWYALHVAPSWYFGPYVDHIIHGVHERVFQHIKHLAEDNSHRVTAL